MTMHNDAPTVAAQQHDVTPAEVGGLWVPANPEHAKLGWTYDFEQTERIARAAYDSTGYDATMEVVEFVMAEADRRHRDALAAKDAELAAVKVSNNKWLAKWERAEAQLAEARKALESAREIVDACAGDNRPAIEWASEVREKIDAALSCAAVAERTPYAYEFGRSNGDYTYSVYIERSLPPETHPDWPVTPLYLDPPPTSELEAENERLRKALDALDRMNRGLDWCDQDEQARRWSAARRALEAQGGE